MWVDPLDLTPAKDVDLREVTGLNAVVFGIHVPVEDFADHERRTLELSIAERPILAVRFLRGEMAGLAIAHEGDAAIATWRGPQLFRVARRRFYDHPDEWWQENDGG